MNKIEYNSIRSIQFSDLPIISDIESQIHMYPWTEGMFIDAFHAGYTGWILQENIMNTNAYANKISAYLIVQTILDECHILTIGVKKDKQRKGYARALLQFLLNHIMNDDIENLSTKCIHKILLEVQESNTPAIKLYRQFGFKQIGIRKNYYQNESALIFAYECQ